MRPAAAALRRQFNKIKVRSLQPSITATLPDRVVQIDPRDILDYFLDAIKAGEAPQGFLHDILAEAEPDPAQGLIYECLRKLVQGVEPVQGEDLYLPRGKQAKSILESTRRLNIWYGSVRSSKTVMSCIRWLQYVLHGPKGRLMMIGQTLDTLELNVIDVLKDLLPAAISFTTGWLHCNIFGRKVRLRSANSLGEVKKLKGPTLAGILGDEVTTWPKEVFKMAQSRISVIGSMLFGTTNPEGPLHWLKVDVLDRIEELNLSVWHFLMEDNPGLTEDYIRDLKAEYVPGTVHYMRFILGMWVAAEGRIYNFFSSELTKGHVVEKLPEHFERYQIGIDFATSSVCVFLLLGKFQGVWYVIKELYWDAVKHGRQKTNDEFTADLEGFLQDVPTNMSRIDCDPGGGGAGLIAQIRRDLPRRLVLQAMNEVIKGIQAVAQAISKGQLKIYSSCINLIRELLSYVWDEKAQQRGEDKPKKQNDHCCDALRYAIMRIFHGTASLGVKPQGL
jgi:PBSX family phage terminase large subunit